MFLMMTTLFLTWNDGGGGDDDDGDVDCSSVGRVMEVGYGHHPTANRSPRSGSALRLDFRQ